MKRVLKLYIQDVLPAILIYALGFGFVVLFYTLATKKQVEIIYPLLLSAFFLIIGLVIYLVRYLYFYKKIEWMELDELPTSESESGLLGEYTKQLWAFQQGYRKQMEQNIAVNEKEMRFFSMLVHTLKTPVTVIDLLIQRHETEELLPEEALSQIKEEKERLLVSLDQTLSMLRLREFQKDYVPEVLDLVEELQVVINKNKKMFIYNHVFPKVETNLEKAMILSDRRWNELMLEQFISNAIKYSGQSEEAKHVIFRLKQREGRVHLWIIDEGIGIPDYDKGKIFEPFFTGENGRKGFSSSGIGLYFCKEVAECLGVTIEVESEVGKGTSMHLSYLAKL